jgi:hypothetical protein
MIQFGAKNEEEASSSINRWILCYENSTICFFENTCCSY